MADAAVLSILRDISLSEIAPVEEYLSRTTTDAPPPFEKARESLSAPSPPEEIAHCPSHLQDVEDGDVMNLFTFVNNSDASEDDYNGSQSAKGNLDADTGKDGEQVLVWSGDRGGRHVEMWRCGGVIGRGAAANVYRGYILLSDGTSTINLEVAVKLVLVEEHLAQVLRCTSETLPARLAFDHPGIIHSYLYVLCPAPGTNGLNVSPCGISFPVMYGLGLEYANGGILTSLVRRRERLSEEHIRRVLQDVVSAVAYTHDHGFVHNDIKPQNILVCGTPSLDKSMGIVITEHTDSVRYKISDFGVAHIAEPLDVAAILTSPPEEILKLSSKMDAPLGTATYMSPEACIGFSHCRSNDVWSIGITAFFLATGRLPWRPLEAANPSMILHGFRSKLTLGRLFRSGPTSPSASNSGSDTAEDFGPILDELRFDHGYSTELLSFVTSCLTENPEDRPTAHQLLEHAFMTGT